MRLWCLSLAVLFAASVSLAADVAPVSPGYQPQDADERGLWQQMNDVERELKSSNFVMRDEGLNSYVRSVFCRTVTQDRCREVRIYLVRTPYFNASMAPNGMMLVYSGLFLRARDEAQLAAVLAHEYTHYAERHSVRNFRDAKKKTNALAWMSVIPVASYGQAVAMTIGQYGLLGSIFAFSRDMERAADVGSVKLLADAQYDPMSASRIWEQLRAEMDATAAARGKRSRKNRDGGIYASHPSTFERMTELKALATRLVTTSRVETGRARYVKALAKFWPDLIDDQIKLNDFGATDFLLTDLARDGWTSDLLFAKGELYRSRGRPEDLKQAVTAFEEAIAKGSPPTETWRGLGLSLLRLDLKQEGQAALRLYLDKRPDAKDRAMIAALAGVTQ
jgi:Zn-dependent protease with chaperone function